MKSTDPPTGLARRKQRLTDEETAQRMLAAAIAMVHRTGLTVSLEHVSLEDVIRDAGVSRSAAYRRWPYKDLFLSDLVRELAQDSTPEMADDELRLVKRIIAEREAWLDSAQGRRDLIVELFRQLSAHDFDTMYASTPWRTYIALHATFMSLPDGDLRREVQASLAASERRRSARIARAWVRLAELFGYRLRPDTSVSFGTFATILSAHLRGLILITLADPELASQRIQAKPFGGSKSAEWTLAGLGLASTVTALLEPDPAVAWDAERVETVKEALRNLEMPPA